MESDATFPHSPSLKFDFSMSPKREIFPGILFNSTRPTPTIILVSQSLICIRLSLYLNPESWFWLRLGIPKINPPNPPAAKAAPPMSKPQPNAERVCRKLLPSGFLGKYTLNIKVSTIPRTIMITIPRHVFLIRPIGSVELKRPPRKFAIHIILNYFGNGGLQIIFSDLLLKTFLLQKTRRPMFFARLCHLLPGSYLWN